MDNEPIIFENFDVYESIYMNLRYTRACNANDTKSCIKKWCSSPPRFTTIRVNSLLTSLNDIEEFISQSLTKEAARRGLPVPLVSRHQELPDLLVLSPWSTEAPQEPRHRREVIVDASCGTAVLRGAQVFAPGVLGLPSDTQEGDEVSVYADTSGRCKRGLSVPFSDHRKAFVGNGVMKMSRKNLFQKDLHPKGVAVDMTDPASNVASVKLPSELGLLQNLPSALCSHVVSPNPGDKVIDLCAAPGHKTTHLAALMDNQGVLVALDKIPRKIEALQSLCKTMGADCVKAFTFDATTAVSANAGSDWAPPFAPNTFDHVLLDAPCSALGQRPQMGNKVTSKQIASYPKLQRKLFYMAAQLVRPGGSLVYSTCSVTVEENEDVVSWALVSFPQLDLVPALPLLGKPGSSRSSLSETQCSMVQRFGPPIGSSPEEDTIGFFIAKFIRKI